jgi:hypothetical protein
MSYRYSTLQVFDKLGISLGIAAVPKYQDATIKIDLPFGASDRVGFTSLGGISDIGIQLSTQDTAYTGDFDIYDGTDIGLAGITWRHIHSATTSSEFTVAAVSNRYRTRIDSLTTPPVSPGIVISPWYRDTSSEGYFSAKYRMAWSGGVHHQLQAGVELRNLRYGLSARRLTQREGEPPYQVAQDGSSLQPISFVNWNWRPADGVTFNSGIYAQYLAISRRTSVEPRLSAAWDFTPTQTLSLGFGIHRQTQPLAIYFINPGNATLDFTQAIHVIAGYRRVLSDDWLVKIEAYSKRYSNAPIQADSSTSYSLLNAGADFGSVGTGHLLASAGRGRTYGMELTLTKNFSEGYYVTTNGSYLRQEYVGSDGIWRFGAFDNRFVANLLAGAEWKIAGASTIAASFKWTIAGGAPYTPVDLPRSRLFGGTYFNLDSAYTLRNPVYEKLDIRVELRSDFSGWSLIAFVTVENLFDHLNAQERRYNPRLDRVDLISQLGRLPYGGFRLEF